MSSSNCPFNRPWGPGTTYASEVSVVSSSTTCCNNITGNIVSAVSATASAINGNSTTTTSSSTTSSSNTTTISSGNDDLFSCLPSIRKKGELGICPYNDCKKQLLQKGMSRHIKDVHNRKPEDKINSRNYLDGICIDPLVGKYWTLT